MKAEADVTIELHIHGYGVVLDAGPGNEAVAEFGADLTGRFGIEDHRSGREVGVLVVGPR